MNSMTFYVATCERNPNLTIQVHPLLLSLTEMLNTSEKILDIRNISESDERALRSNLYTSPSVLPPLEIHFSGQNGLSLLFNKKWLYSHIGSWLPRVYGICPSRQFSSEVAHQGR